VSPVSLQKSARLPMLVTWLIFWGLPFPGFAETRVVDDFGHDVVLSKPAQRIISLAPHNTENLFSAGAGHKIVGVVEYSDYPPQALEIQSVGSYIQFNLELIVSLEPDLIVAWQNGNNRESLERLESLGFTVYYSEPRTFQDILDNIVELAQLAGTADKMAPGVNDFAGEIRSLQQQYENKSGLDVFYQVWTDPLMTLNGDHFITRVLDLCGADNLFADLPIIAPRVSIESVIEANPDVIVTGMVDGLKPDMSLWDDWQTIKAVHNKSYIFVDSDVMHRHTLRMLEGISGFCQSLDAIRQNQGDG
jgi:iron complex transport system substrate-binding protein